MYFYTVTVFNTWEDKRVMYLGTEFSKCVRIVQTNESDIHEYFYRYCIIEQFRFGFVYGDVSEILRQYEWNHESHSWKEPAAPFSFLKDSTNFSLG